MISNLPNLYYPTVVEAIPSLEGKIYAITGTTSGTGYYTARAAIQKNAAAVLLLNRPSTRAVKSETKLKQFAAKQGSKSRIYTIHCDLQKFDTVHSAAEIINRHCSAFGGLDGLLNNAGIMAAPDKRTMDGFDVQMQTNHLSHFLLTKLLMPSLKMAAKTRGESRIVQHSSGARNVKRALGEAKGNLEKQFFAKCQEGSLGGDNLGACFNRYHQTKLSNTVFAIALHKVLKGMGVNVKSIVCEPGVAATDLVSNLSMEHRKAGNDISSAISNGNAAFPGVQSAADGSCSLIMASFANNVNSGDMFMPGELIKNTVVGIPVKCIQKGIPTPPTEYIKQAFQMEELTMSIENQNILWEMSEIATGVHWEERKGNVSAKDVRKAAKLLSGKVIRTPLLESLALNLMTKARILVKAENLQTGGSFKVRGALHRVLKLSPEEKERGVVCFSSGNFGQGLAAACGQIMQPRINCTIVMPGDTPMAKQNRARSYGATVVLSEIRKGINREVTAAELAEKLANDHKYTLLHPFEDHDVIAGQGSCAVEICEQFHERQMNKPHMLLIPTGGGGLSAGCALATNDVWGNSVSIYAVEPEGYDDHRISFNIGKISRLTGNPPSLCDSLQAVSPGQNTFPITNQLLKGSLVVNDDEVRYAMKVAFETLQIVLEPGGAVGLAAILSGKCGNIEGKTIVVIASGGNTDYDKFTKIVNEMKVSSKL
jgi:threonine dehydratase